MAAQRCIVFFDGQNLYRRAKEVWGPLDPKADDPKYNYPSYDVLALAGALVARASNRTLEQIRFYTGVPAFAQDKHWSAFWANKLRHLERNGCYVYRGRISSNNHEKGVDVSIAVDLIKLTYERRYDVAILVSEDSDLGPAIDTARQIAFGAKIKLGFESAFPYDADRFKRLGRRPYGIPGAEAVLMSSTTYDACLDPNDYRGNQK
jgi:uncharacterized LabA/DUF88 family protein